jgi:hypothetical protein
MKAVTPVLLLVCAVFLCVAAGSLHEQTKIDLAKKILESPGAKPHAKYVASLVLNKDTSQHHPKRNALFNSTDIFTVIPGRYVQDFKTIN